VEEISLRFKTHKNTVRQWLKVGLPTIDEKRPILILGRDLKSFLQARRIKNKRPCEPGQIYCVRCRVPKCPAGDIAEYKPITASLGNLMGICPDCDAMLYRRVGRDKLAHIQGNLEVTISEAERQVSDSS
jgi:hypothetical protein